jgi:transcriptional regulator with XRE-family HTH domain
MAQTNLGDALKKWRLMSQLEQRGAARQIGISASTLCRLEKGEVKPDADTFLKILRWLISPSETK